jgi:hypothetical protein
MLTLEKEVIATCIAKTLNKFPFQLGIFCFCICCCNLFFTFIIFVYGVFEGPFERRHLGMAKRAINWKRQIWKE